MKFNKDRQQVPSPGQMAIGRINDWMTMHIHREGAGSSGGLK